MPQCDEYPEQCNGLVIRSEKDDKWLCQKHFYTLEHLKSIGLK